MIRARRRIHQHNESDGKTRQACCWLLDESPIADDEKYKKESERTETHTVYKRLYAIFSKELPSARAFLLGPRSSGG